MLLKIKHSSLLAPYCTHLSKGFLPIVLEVFRVDIEVVFIDGEWLGALSNAGYKLLYFQKGAARPVAFKVLHWDIGGSDTICRQEMRGVITGFEVKI